jgi:hypothetical protein
MWFDLTGGPPRLPRICSGGVGEAWGRSAGSGSSVLFGLVGFLLGLLFLCSLFFSHSVMTLLAPEYKQAISVERNIQPDKTTRRSGFNPSKA